MNFREKVTAQIIASLMIFSSVKSVGMINWEPVNEMKAWVSSHINTNYTAEEVKAAASELLERAGSAGEVLASAVISANKAGQSDNVLGEADEKGIRVVYAPDGGDVVSVGISDELGMYVRIRHDGKISLYGNLADIAVLTGERVRKGDIIGSYDSNSVNEFIYELTDIDFSQEI